MVYTVDFEGDANLRARDITILRNATFANLNTSSNLEVGTANFFVDTTSGNVGIGTASPEYTLDVAGTSNAATYYQNDVELYAQRRWEVDLTGQSTDNFYPVELKHPNYEGSPDLPDMFPVHFKVFGESLGNSDAYNENTLVGYARGGGWSDHIGMYDVHYRRHNGGIGEKRFEGLYRGTESFSEGIVIYMRGGYRYSVLTDATEVNTYTSVQTLGNAVFAIKDVDGDDVSGTSANIERMVHLAGTNDGEKRFVSGNLQFDGNVGIGTASPVTKCQIAGKTTISENISTQNASRVYDADLSVVSEIGYDQSGTADIDIGATTSYIGNYTTTYRYKLYTDVVARIAKFKIASVSGPSGTYNGYGTVTDRITLDPSGNVGIGINSPDTSFHVVNPNATNPTWYNASYLDDSACMMVSENNYNVETARAASTHYTTLILSSDHAYDSGNNAAGSVSFAAKNEFGGYSVQYGQISGVRLGNFYGGLSFATMHSLNDGKLREDMRIANGNVGIGVTDPVSKLELGAAFSSEGNTTNMISFRNSPSGYYDWQIGPTVYSSTAAFSIRGGADGYGNLSNIFNIVNTSVGIGTTVPYAKLHVNGADGALASASRAYFAYFDSSSAKVQYNTGDWNAMSIYGSGSIATGVYFVSHAGTISASDERIKKNIVDADDAECLEVLRLLKPKKYQYKDEINRGTEPVWGFIAQEVRETLPHATQLRQDVLPNIYELANVSSSNVITFTNFNTSNLESNATTLIRTKGIDGEDHDVHLVEVIDEHTIRVEEDLTEWIGSVDETGNVITEITTTTITPEEYEGVEDTSGYVANISGYQNANVVISVEEYNALEDTAGYEEIIDNYTKTVTTYPGTQLFVYGQQVNDFVFIKKEAIWTVASAALQEVDRQLQAEKAKVATLETQLASVLTRLDALESV